MRTIWNGSISFGLVNIPVGLALATQRQDVSFRTLHRECGTPIKQKRWCPVHERDVEPDELVKGWEFAKGQYVLVEEADLEAVALTALAVDRDPPLRQARGRRPRLLRPHLLPRTRRRRRAAKAVRPPSARDGGVGDGRGRQVRPLGQGEPLPHPRQGRRAPARDALLRRGRPREDRDRGGGRRDRRAEGRAAARRAGHLEPRGRVDARGLRERLPERPRADARGEARRPGDRRAGARRRGACDRPDGSAAPERRRRAEPPLREGSKDGKARSKAGSRSRKAPAKKSA